MNAHETDAKAAAASGTQSEAPGEKQVVPHSDGSGSGGASQAAASETTEGFLVIDRGGVVREADAAAVRFFEAEAREDLIGLGLFSLAAPEFGDDAARVRETIFDSPRSEFSWQIISRKGQRKRATFCSVPLPPPGSAEFESVLVFVREIPPEQIAERERRLLLRAIADSAVDAIITCTPDFRITSWNRGAEVLYGYGEREAIGQSLDIFIPPRFRDDVRSLFARVARGGRPLSYETTRNRRDGSPVDVAVSLFALRDESGVFVGAGTITRNIGRQKHLERELREAQLYTRSLIESSVDAMLTVDRNLAITDVNGQMVKLTEVPKSMLVGSRFDSYFTEPERAAQGVRKTLEDGCVTNYDLMLQAPSGRRVMVSFNASIFRDALGKIRGVFAVARDVTEQRSIERRLREQQNYSRGLIESSIDVLMTIDPELKVTDVNQQTVRITGYSRGELIGSPFPAFFVKPSRAADGARKAFAEGFVRDYELILRAKDGHETEVSLNASIFNDVEGHTAGIFAAARDISQRKQLEQEHAYLASIVASSEDAIYSLNQNAVVRSWNLGAQRLFGYSAEEIIGRSFAICVPLDRRTEMLDMMGKVMRGEGIQQFETKRLRKDGTAVDVSLTMSPISDPAGKVAAVSVIGRDISERNRFEAALAAARDEALEAVRLKSEFLANMSHEIRTPLNSIIGMTGLLLDSKLAPEQNEFATDVAGAGEALLGIINDILDFSKISAGKITLESIDFELLDAVEGSVELVADQAQKKGLELAISIEHDTPLLLRGDPGRSRQVLANLLSNAVKFTDRGEVVVTVTKVDETDTEAVLRFDVRDTGIGIAKEAQARLFQPFTQPDPSTTRKYGGTGLGLAIARQLVAALGGNIGMVSAPGVGSTFWFTAKFAKQAYGTVASVAPEFGLEGLRILVVDDNATNREILQRQLAAWGVLSDVASSAAEALSLLRQQASVHPYELALLDMQMPEVDGLELAHRIRQDPALAGLSLIVLSSMGGRAEYGRRAAGLDIGACLIKPVKPSQLKQSLQKILALKSSAPIAEPPAQASPEEGGTYQETVNGGAAVARGPELRVLVAEDNVLNQKVAVRQLRKLGYFADVAANGREAIEAASQVPYDVVLMDCQMPVMDGYEATAQIRRREAENRRTKIIAMTAHALSGDREKCLAAGMDDYISKPVKLENLAEVLKRVSFLRDRNSPGKTRSVYPERGPDNGKEVVSAKAIAELRKEGGNFLTELIDLFEAEVPEQLKSIEEALAKCDGPSAVIAAHALKGDASAFEAMRMQGLCIKLEQLARSRSVAEAKIVLGELRSECERVRRALEVERTGGN